MSTKTRQVSKYPEQQVRFVDTKAQGVSLATQLPDGATIFVRVDESNDGLTTSYVVAGGILSSPTTFTSDVEAAIGDHNADAAAHPALSAFITSEANRAEAAADAAEDSIQYQYLVDSDSEREAITGMTIGQHAFVRNTEHVWRYNGSAWVDLGLGPTASKASRTELAGLERRILAAGAAEYFIDNTGADEIPLIRTLDGYLLAYIHRPTQTVRFAASAADPGLRAVVEQVLTEIAGGPTDFWTGAGSVVPLIRTLDGYVVLGYDLNAGRVVGAFGEDESAWSEGPQESLAGDLLPSRSDWNLVLLDGESTQVAGGSSTVISSAQPYANIGWPTGPSSSLAGSVGSNPGMTSVGPLVEIAARAEGSGGGETPTSAMCNYAVECAAVEQGVLPTDMVLFGSNAAHSGYRLDQVQWGSEWGQLKIDQVTQFKAMADAAGKTSSVLAVYLDITVNDSDSSKGTVSAAAYESALRNYIDGVQSNLRSITGQVEPIHVLIGMPYTFMVGNLDGQAITDAINAVIDSEPLAHAAPANWRLPSNGDTIHQSAAGSKLKGLLAGPLVAQLWRGVRPQTLRMVSATADGTTVRMRFDVRFRPLRIDLTNLPVTTDYGIRLRDDTGILTLSNIRVENDVEIVMEINRSLAANPVASIARYYSGAGSQYHQGPTCNIRDSNPTVKTIGGTEYRMFSVPAAQSKPIIVIGA